MFLFCFIILDNIVGYEYGKYVKSKISALRKDPRPYSRCLHGVFVMNFGFTLTLTPTITLTIAPKEADTSPPPEQTNKQV